MAAYISKKQAWFRCGASFFSAAAAAALLCNILAGPRLGFLYDILLRQRPALPLAEELLIIDTLPPAKVFPESSVPDSIMEPLVASSLLMTMTELDASALILQVPVLGLSTGNSSSEEEIRLHFNREFDLLGRNIRNLFDAIRTGSIAPSESALYVGELVELSEGGKERLVSALVSRDTEGVQFLENAAKVFGNVRCPEDLMVQLIQRGNAAYDTPGLTSPLAERGGYSKSRPDTDGILRRIAPLRTAFEGEDGFTLEHVIYSALKTRYRNPGIVNTETGPVLFLSNQYGGAGFSIPLDKNLALLFEIPRHGEDFRRIWLKDFLDYDQADRLLRRLLGEAEALGIYSLIQGEENPLFLYDYCLSLREELLAKSLDPSFPVEWEKSLWINARENYFTCLDSFLYGPSEMNLVNGYELILSTENLGEKETENIKVLRDSLIRSFVELRQKYNEVLELRIKLKSALADSFCILGPGSAAINSSTEPAVQSRFPNPFSPFQTWTDTEASAFLANSMLTGRSIIPGSELILFLSTLAIALIAAILICPRKASSGLGIGLILALLTGLGYSWSFILSGIWLDPLVPLAAVGMVTLVSFIHGLGIKVNFNRLFRSSYGPSISRSGLRLLIRTGRPAPRELLSSNAAVVAIRNPALVIQEDRENPLSSAAAILEFREKTAEAFRRAGGIVTGNGGDLMLACFGSPLERTILGGKVPRGETIYSRGAPAIRAIRFITELLGREENKLWSFGLDTGTCAFTWSPLSGYTVLGKPVIRARILTGLTDRYHCRVLVSASVNNALSDVPSKRVGILKERDGTGGEPFYELLL